jgi:hypothetical protein
MPTDEEKKTETSPQLIAREIPIKYYGVEDVTGIFADQAMIFHAGETFTLFFFQSSFPPTEDVDELNKLTEIPAKCVARIVLTPALMRQVSDAITKNLARFDLVLERVRKTAEEQS